MHGPAGSLTSADLRARALRVIPGGVHSPVRAFKSVGGDPIFFRQGSGARLVDVEGRSYIDFCQSFGPLILGHADPDVAAAAHAAIDDGWSYGACEPYSLDLAEWIAGRLPWVERIRFVSSGTEAVMSALRVARAATGRSAILKFEGCYHGHTDAMLVEAGSGLAGRVAASSAGIPDGILGDTIVAPLDDDHAVDRAFEQHGSRIAAVILEPLPANYGLLPQRAAWIHRVVDRARSRGALVIFDEVISGFRAGRGGMAEALGIRPDLVTYGKVIGGGFPVAAYAGRADLLDLVAPAGPVYQAGTLSANPVGMRTGLATLGKMERLDGWRVLDERTSRFCARLSAELHARHAGLTVVQQASIFWLHLTSSRPLRRVDALPEAQAPWYGRFFHAALRRGVYLPPAAFEVCFLSMAHDDETLTAAGEALVAAAVEAGAP
ncbi:MAG TPA: glutamate-1-semialdehyde 2,1-aminomutase [Vicinamibacterales bacterium]|nr:glutamate-1-semialdehyde 2,1-aminomutase [Vicinamibacterales bacterium]